MNANGTYTITIDDRDVELLKDMAEGMCCCFGLSLADATAAVREQYVISRKLLELGKHSTFYAGTYKDKKELNDIITNECTFLDRMIHALYHIRTGKDIEKRLLVDVNITKNGATMLFTLATDDETKAFKKASGKQNLTTLCCGCLKSTIMSKLKKCGACKEAQYCSLECQKAHWKTHKTTCCK